VLVIQEGCGQSDLEYFNKTWLKNAYETVIVLPTNTERDQELEMLIKPGFRVVQKKTDYYKEADSEKNKRGDRLFARGPSFVLIQAPSGYRFWVGTNHQKSKSDNTVDITKWRNREAKRTHEIIKELEKSGPEDVIFLGDMNDELGIQEFELEGGGDVITNLVGKPEDGIILATKPLAESGQISFGGYWRGDHRSFIDHAFVTSGMKTQIDKVEVFHNDYTQAASDHFPVMIRFKADPMSK
jgi:endonuclease/exonuclease/phosphatase family metal-dependent hydrolase